MWIWALTWYSQCNSSTEVWSLCIWILSLTAVFTTVRHISCETELCCCCWCVSILSVSRFKKTAVCPLNVSCSLYVTCESDCLSAEHTLIWSHLHYRSHCINTHMNIDHLQYHCINHCYELKTSSWEKTLHCGQINIKELQNISDLLIVLQYVTVPWVSPAWMKDIRTKTRRNTDMMQFHSFNF